MKLIEIVAKDDLLRSWNDYTISDEGDPLDFEYRQISENGVYHSTYLFLLVLVNIRNWKKSSKKDFYWESFATFLVISTGSTPST